MRPDERTIHRALEIACGYLAGPNSIYPPTRSSEEWMAEFLRRANSGPIPFVELRAGDIIRCGKVRKGMPQKVLETHTTISVGTLVEGTINTVFEDGVTSSYTMKEYGAAGFERTTSDKFY